MDITWSRVHEYVCNVASSFTKISRWHEVEEARLKHQERDSRSTLMLCQNGDGKKAVPSILSPWQLHLYLSAIRRYPSLWQTYIYASRKVLRGYWRRKNIRDATPQDTAVRIFQTPLRRIQVARLRRSPKVDYIIIARYWLDEDSIHSRVCWILRVQEGSTKIPLERFCCVI